MSCCCALRLPGLLCDPIPIFTFPHTQDTLFSQGQSRLPRSSYLYLCRTVIRSIAVAFVKLFSPEGAVKAFNLFAIRKLSEEVSELRTVAAGANVPDVELEFSEVWNCEDKHNRTLA